MEVKQKIHNLIILDESGSMNSIKDQIISGFNEVVQTVKGVAKKYPEQKHYITFITFNALHIVMHLYCKPVLKLEELNRENYKPEAGTPLFDAMGYGINELQKKLSKKTKTNVLVTILTDGLENASTEYDTIAIKSLVEEMEEKNWTFTYIGTDHDVTKFAQSISIKNSLRFMKDPQGLKKMFQKERISRIAYSQKIKENKNTKDDYFKNED